MSINLGFLLPLIRGDVNRVDVTVVFGCHNCGEHAQVCGKLVRCVHDDDDDRPSHFDLQWRNDLERIAGEGWCKSHRGPVEVCEVTPVQFRD